LRDAREPRLAADERPHSFGWERGPDYSRTLRVGQVLRDGVVLAFDQADDGEPSQDWDGEARNRTGDTTIFRDAVVGA
jgi:hypothetical protein